MQKSYLKANNSKSFSCLVNNHVCGTGTGTTKQLAKEEAAKEAFLALRLDTYGKY